MCLCLLQSDRFFNALKGHGALCRLVVLPYESHGYAARESIMHVLWETDRWLQKYCVSNASDVNADLNACKDDGSKGVVGSEAEVVAASGGGNPELADLDHDQLKRIPRSLLWYLLHAFREIFQHHSMLGSCHHVYQVLPLLLRLS